MYSSTLLDHFQHPRNSGIIDAPTVSVQAENPACGDVMKLMLRIKEEKITEIKYQVRGCVAAIACGSALTEIMAGKSLKDVAAIRREQLVESVGGLPGESMHASHLVMDCVKLALTQLEK